jgi:hypothetical protein
MCNRCAELDGKIEHYQRLSRMVTDQPTLDAIEKLTGELRAEKVALHPDQQD